MTTTRMVLSLAQMPALSSGGPNPHGTTAHKVGLVLPEHIPGICTIPPPHAWADHLLTGSTSAGIHVPRQRQSGMIHRSPNC